MTGWRALVAMVAAAALILPVPADAARPKRKAPPRAAKAVVAAGPVVLPDIALPPPRPAALEARRKTELADLAGKRTGHDYNVRQLKLLARYDTPPDKRHAYAIDHDFSTVEAPRFGRYLDRIADRLLACWPGPRPPIRILIDGTSAPRAYANDSGLIRLSAGLLNDLETTDAVAFVLAHEIAHVLYEHQAKREALQRAIEKGVGILASATILTREVQFKSAGGKFDVSMRSQFGSTGYLVSGYSFQRFSDQAVIPFRKADQEFEADRLAYDLIGCAKFDPDGAKSAVLILGTAERPDLTALRAAAQIGAAYITSVLVKPKKEDFKGNLLKFGARLLIGKGLDAAIDGIADELEKSMGGVRRSAKLEEYLGKTYPPPPDVLTPADTAYAQLKSDPYWTSLLRVVTAVTAVDAALHKAQTAAGPGKTYPANPAYFAPWHAIGRPDPRVPHSYEIAGLAAGLGPVRRQAYDSGSRLHWGYRRMLSNAGDVQFAMGDAGALRQTASLARERLGNVPEVLPLDVQLAVLNEEPVAVETLAAQCLTKGGDTLYARCVQPLGYDPACSPRTPEGKAALDAAMTARKANSFLNLPGLAASLNAPPPQLLKCQVSAGMTSKQLGLE